MGRHGSNTGPSPSLIPAIPSSPESHRVGSLPDIGATEKDAWPNLPRHGSFPVSAPRAPQVRATSPALASIHRMHRPGHTKDVARTLLPRLGSRLGIPRLDPLRDRGATGAMRVDNHPCPPHTVGLCKRAVYRQRLQGTQTETYIHVIYLFALTTSCFPNVVFDLSSSCRRCTLHRHRKTHDDKRAHTLKYSHTPSVIAY